MNYEQKYKDALERAKDERIRKAIKKALQVRCGGSRIISDEPVTLEEAIAWLEKQGEKKPTDKAEPKFKVGDWITNGDYTWKIVGVKPLDYILQSQDGNIVDDTISYVDEHFHLWSIQDAKDGDVLVNYIEGGKCIAIFKSIIGKNNTEIYCHLVYNEFIPKPGHSNAVWQPATKEDSYKLFFEMYEAGYEWGAEKKEVKKIEPKTLDADKVIAWLVANICDFEYYVKLFKKDFKL